MERNKVGALNSCNGDFDSEIFITQESRTEIFWWVNNLKSENGKLIRPIQINFWIETDASLEGWGANFEGQFAGAQYIPGIENFDADHMSRNFTDSTEWQLKVEIFDRICKHFFVPNVDLFASRLNFQVPRFASWSFDPQATYVDAFTISWSNFRPYIFPPFTLLGKILMKIISDKVEKAILIIPFWPAQSWFSLLIPMLISLPVRLPQHKRFSYDAAYRRMPSIKEETKFNRVHCIRKSLLDRGFSESSADVIIASWRPSTIKQYQYSWRKFVIWCVQRKTNYFRPSEKDVIDYLNFLKKQ
ncbi:Hypothetical predicted protein [Mytilus galloprovincialis]|uniref:Core-binding (CB) domain-containing protein n=1 Tax=Mytilus galloprovincialis TaxID=29158 RepID=A0A8B6HPM0_MYTGA|nr:Hypothetical predicted protein [Mytilus galloprovincialis]